MRIDRHQGASQSFEIPKAMLGRREPVRFVSECEDSGQLVTVGGIAQIEGTGRSIGGFAAALRAQELWFHSGSTASVCDYHFGLTNATLTGVGGEFPIVEPQGRVNERNELAT